MLSNVGKDVRKISSTWVADLGGTCVLGSDPLGWMDGWMRFHSTVRGRSSRGLALVPCVA